MGGAQIKRRQNERKFGNWESLPGGGRRYWYEVPAAAGGRPGTLRTLTAKKRPSASGKKYTTSRGSWWRSTKSTRLTWVTNE